MKTRIANLLIRKSCITEKLGSFSSAVDVGQRRTCVDYVVKSRGRASRVRRGIGVGRIAVLVFVRAAV